jgi:CheY-like chemotaxis protein
VDSDLPHVLVDEAELEQTLVNLMMNARDALLSHASTTPPRVRVTARLGPLPPSVRPASATPGLLISVEDNGPGVPPEVAERMFEPFFTTKPEGQGTGLGLSMAQRFVLDAGGSIELVPVEGGGARFVLALPATTAVTPPRVRKPVETPRASLDGLSVLVVDDEAGVRKAVGRLLERMGATVHLAEGARRALEVASEQRPMIILLDRTMPDGPGEAIIDELRVRVPSVIIVLFSGEPINEELTARVDGYLAKPISSDELVAAIARFGRPAAT